VNVCVQMRKVAGRGAVEQQLRELAVLREY